MAAGVYWVGIRHWERRLFDSLIPLPSGTTYNCYLLTGKDKMALIDTVNPGFESELKTKLLQMKAWGKIDYVIMNHAEPDHAGAVPFVLNENPHAKLILTSKGAKMAKIMYGISDDKMSIVKEGDRIQLGELTLRFIEAPFLHWPETMFTYLEESRVLFTCDFFGAHNANGVYSDEVEDYMHYAKKYFGEIMMPFSKNGKSALEKISGLDIALIAPSHGPMHRDPLLIISAYLSWTGGKTKPKIVVFYVSMWGATKAMVDVFWQTLSKEGVEVVVYDLTVSDLATMAGDLVDSCGIVLAAPTVLNGMHPLGLHAANLVKILKPPARFAAILSSYGWGGGAVKQAAETLAPLKMEILGTIEVNGYPMKDDICKVELLAKKMAQTAKESI
ncbi:MAG: FprA family A-type flavoprotein [Methanomassiliicoccales archaeon]